SVGANTRIVEANRAASLMLGVERTKLLGKCLSGFVEPHMAGVFALHCRAVLESDQVQNCELLLVVGEGTRRVRLESARVSAAAQHWRTAVLDATLAARMPEARSVPPVAPANAD